MAESLSGEAERKIIEEEGMSVDSYRERMYEIEQKHMDWESFRDFVGFFSQRAIRPEDAQVLRIKARIEYEKKKTEEREAGPKKYVQWMTIREAYFGTRRSIEVEVDEGSTANFVTRGMAADWGYEVRSLGSESFLGDTINGNVICGEYIELTLVDEGHQNIVAIFNVLPHNDPPNAPRITKPLIGRQLLQESGHLLLAEDPRDPVWSTKMGKETGLVRDQREQDAASVEAYHANVSSTGSAPKRDNHGKNKKAQDRSSSSSEKQPMHTQPAFSSAKGTELTGMVPSESTESANERHKPVKDWKLTSDIQNIVGLSHWMNTIVPGTEHQHSIALEFNLGSMSAFLRDEYSDLKEPAEILQILTVTGSPQLAYADTAEAYLKWQWLRELLRVDLLIERRPTQSHLRDFHLAVTGPLDAISNVIRVLAWVLSVFRKGRGEQLSLFSAQVILQDHVSEIAPPALVIDIEELSHTDSMPKDGTCWHALFCNFAVATSFPIPPRTDAQGIELPFNLMSLLARVEYPIPHGCGFILKGQRSALMPQRKSKEADGRQLVQWHLTLSSDKSTLPMENVPQTLDNLQPNFSDIDGIVSEENRHILGMYDRTAIDFGTQSSQGQKFDTCQRSGDVKPQGQGLSFGWGRSISLNANGSVFGFASLGASTTFTPRLPKSVVNKILEGEPTPRSLVEQACKELTLVYDTEAKLAWLLPEICVIFQLMQIYANCQDLSLPSIETIASDFEIRRKDCKDFVLGLQEEPMQIFQRFCGYFRQMKDDVNFKQREQRRLSHRDPGTTLSGVDFVKLAEATPGDAISLLKVDIDAKKAGCWVEMLKANWEQSLQHGKDPGKHPEGLKVVALFCHSLSRAPIRHKTNSCQIWSPAPQGYDYLITTVGCLSRIADVQGAETGRLSPQHWWQLGAKEPFDFAKCQAGGSSGSCNRLQKLRKEKKKPHFKDLKKVGAILKDASKVDGAIIFGEEFWLPTNCPSEPCILVPPANSCGPRSEQANGTNS